MAAKKKVTIERAIEELALVAFLPVGEAGEGKIKAAEKIKALELLLCCLRQRQTHGEENPLAALTLEELRLLARAQGEREKRDGGENK